MIDQFGNNHMYLLSFRKSLMIFLFFQGAGLTGGHHHTLVVSR